ncbi:type III secretion protein HrpE [Citrobacter sp. Igbk 16]|uniref:type III secretion protein HrpE n=1 Tax=Citrobacter sp. Igbk 16 TaxID=2963958 RepID=UPI0023021472|nr:type III secretion protein HrpE [Citrobacter sp. Igbk 16]MDA8519061.1 type III secretion protein HrpE [Citrobacter sp. Igbk 16]
MLRQISLPKQYLPDTPLIKAKWLNSATSASRLEQLARKHAQHMLRDARNEADELRSLAWMEGYSQGIQKASQTVVDYVSNIESATSQLLKHSQHQLDKQLQQLFASEAGIENMLALLAHYLSRDAITDRKAIVSFPAYAIRSAKAISDNFKQSGIDVELRTCQAAKLRVEYGQEIWCCDFQRQPSQLAKLAITASFATLNIAERLEEYRQQAVESVAE